jgi:DnaJ-class molecular chaperone
MTIATTSVSTTCTSCGGNGWLPGQAAGLTLGGWSTTLCRECGGSGAVRHVESVERPLLHAVGTA